MDNKYLNIEQNGNCEGLVDKSSDNTLSDCDRQQDVHGNDTEKIRTLCNTYKHRVIGQFFFRDVMFTNMTNPDLLQSLNNFDVRNQDIFICGYPKSGTTWLQEIVSLIFHNADIEKAREVPVYLRVPYFEQHSMQNMINSIPSPRLLKTHLPYAMMPQEILSKKAKLIYITRNPKDVATSYYYFYKSLKQLGSYSGTFDEYLQMFKAGFVVIGSWFDHTKSWMSRTTDTNVLCVTYEDISTNRREIVNKIAQFCQKDITQSQVDSIVANTSFDIMKSHPSTNFSNNKYIDDTISPFMRKGMVGDWKNHFSASQSNDFDKHYQEKLGHMDLKMVYS